MPNPLDVLIRDYASPALVAAGYRRTGRTFRRQRDRDWALVQVSPGLRLVDGLLRFSVTLWICPAPLLSLQSYLSGKEPGSTEPGSEKMWDLDGVPAPHQFQDPLFAPTGWRVDPEGKLHECGVAMEAGIFEYAIPLLETLLIRENLVAYIRNESLRGVSFHPSTKARNELVASADWAAAEDLWRLYAEIPDKQSDFNLGVRGWLLTQIEGRTGEERLAPE